MLGNLAGEGSATRDLVLNAGALVPLVNNLKKTPADRSSLLRILTWTLSNLCDGQPRPVFDISIILPSLAKVCVNVGRSRAARSWGDQRGVSCVAAGDRC